ncbi:MAG: M20/M25/M40 family metallo-hydrolase [Sphaerochaeta sp.]
MWSFIMLFLFFLLPLGIFLLVLVSRTAFLRTRSTTNEDPKRVSPDERMESILLDAIACKTVSHTATEATDWKEFAHLATVLQKSFPHCETKRIRDQEIGPYNLVYRFPGENTKQEPALLTAHLDVVGATEQQWSHPPFKGTLDSTYLYGRGSFDCKLQVISILSAFEALLEQNQQPKTTWYVAFGCDEESNGSEEGASKISRYFKNQGLHFKFVLDEGGVVSQKYIKGFEQSIAVVGVAEKGYLDLELASERIAGHSSTPAFPTALGNLGRAIHRLERHQMPARLTPPVKQMLVRLGKEGPFFYSLLFLNLWLTGGLLKWIFSKQATLNAAIRTTVVPTVISASEKSNVIAKKATAQVNIRLLNGDTEERVATWVKNTIKDPSISIRTLRFTPPSKVSSSEGKAFSFLCSAIKHIFPEAIATPYLMMGATDARKYQELSDCIYRFTPARMERSEVDRMHAPDERISRENIVLAKRFYHHLITNW